jgi:DNA-binding response OmpR family regulator
LKILLVEDEPATRETLAAVLKDAHYTVNSAADGQMGLELALACEPDLVLLDIGLPKLDGLHLCERLRTSGYTNPILLLTAKKSSRDRVLGLDAGADDYVVKPFDIPELLARVRALIRRSKAITTTVVTWENLRFDAVNAKVFVGDTQLHLTPKEYCLLELFLLNPKRIFSRIVILDKLWDFAESPGELAVSTHIKCLRQKLKAAGVVDPIETVYGLGYRLRPAKSEPPAPVEAATSANIAQTWQKYQPYLNEQIQTLEAVIQTLQQSPEPDAEEIKRQLQQAEQIAHKLAGSMGIFGLPLGSQLAHELEALFQAPNHRPIDQITERVTALRQHFDQARLKSPEPTPSTSLISSPLIFIVDDDLALAERLRVEAIAWGIRVEVATDLVIARQRIAKTAPNLVLLDLNFPEDKVAGLTLLEELQQSQPNLPVLVFTAQDQLSLREQVLRFGGRAFLHKPLPSYAIMQVILQQLQKQRQRLESGSGKEIWLLDTDLNLGQQLATYLAPSSEERNNAPTKQPAVETALQVVTFTQVEQLWQRLTLCGSAGMGCPSLLMFYAQNNLAPKSIDSLKLCQIIRADPQWQHLPILLLAPDSAPSQPPRQTEWNQLLDQAFAAGADHCLNPDMPVSDLVLWIRRYLGRRNRQPQLALPAAHSQEAAP